MESFQIMYNHTGELFLLLFISSSCAGLLETEFIKSFMVRMGECDKQLENATKLNAVLQEKLTKIQVIGNSLFCN